MDMRIDGVALGITQTTGIDGCVTWTGIVPGPTDGLEEKLPEGWTALTQTEQSFDPGISEDFYSFTFIISYAYDYELCLPLLMR